LPGPGWYRLYWLDRSTKERLLLSAQAQDVAPRPRPVSVLGPAMLTAFGLTEADLADNRAGRLSREQRQRRLREVWYGWVLWLVFGGLSGFCVGANLLHLTAPDPTEPDPGVSHTILVRGMTLVYLVLLSMTFSVALRATIRRRSGSWVTSLTGP